MFANSGKGASIATQVATPPYSIHNHLIGRDAMKTYLTLSMLAVLGLAALPALAAPKTYQVTGPVLELTGDKIVVQKGAEKWEIARGTAAVPADVKVGSRVTVMYSMTAASVVSKDMVIAGPTKH